MLLMERWWLIMKDNLRYRGRVAQVRIYLGKLLRMFIYQNDWKMLFMAALIAGLVTLAVGYQIYTSQEGTMMGCFALVCVCVWNGFFNSIQIICRERPIIKREHRSGMHISAYIAAHMVYQMLLCIAQTIILLVICRTAGVHFPKQGLFSGSFMLDMGITMFLITYAADMIALLISAVVHTTTTAMTVMPFMLIFQLVFSGGVITLRGALGKIKGFTLIYWGQKALCSLADYNSLPMASLWPMVKKFQTVEVNGERPLKYLIEYIEQNNLTDKLAAEAGKYNGSTEYVFSAANLLSCWGVLLVFIIVFAIAAVIILKFVDRDKR